MPKVNSKTMNSKIWTARTLAILRRLYPTFTSGDIADVIGCSDTTVRNKAHELGLQKDPSFKPTDYAGRYCGKRDPNTKQEREQRRTENYRDRKNELNRLYNQARREKRREEARQYYWDHRDDILTKRKQRHQKLIKEL